MTHKVNSTCQPLARGKMKSEKVQSRVLTQKRTGYRPELCFPHMESEAVVCARRSPSPRPSPAGRGRIVGSLRWMRMLSRGIQRGICKGDFRRQGGFGCCFPLPQGEGSRVRVRRSRFMADWLIPTGYVNALRSPSPQPTPARRGRSIAMFLLLLIGPLCAAIQPVGLKCEYASDPLGVNISSPRLSW